MPFKDLDQNISPVNVLTKMGGKEPHNMSLRFRFRLERWLKCRFLTSDYSTNDIFCKFNNSITRGWSIAVRMEFMWVFFFFKISFYYKGLIGRRMFVARSQTPCSEVFFLFCFVFCFVFFLVVFVFFFFVCAAGLSNTVIEFARIVVRAFPSRVDSIFHSQSKCYQDL